MTLTGTVCAFPSISPQKPFRAGTKFNFETTIAPFIAEATSFADLTPSPMWPSKSPIITNA